MSPSPDAPLKVLHAYTGNLYGGIETLLATLARRRDDAPALKPEFALCFDGRLAGELAATGAPVHTLGEVRFRKPWTLLAARRSLARRLRGPGRPDVLVTHACWAHAAFAPVARRAGVPLAFWMHDSASGRHWLERLAARTPPDLVLTNSRHTASTLPNLFPGAPAELIYYPIAAPAAIDKVDARAQVRSSLGADPNSVVIVQVSRMERWKGQSLLIEALSRLRDHSGWEAWVVGGVQRPQEQAYLDELKTAAAAGGVADRVRFLGQRADVPQLLAAADVHCQPNVGPEPFGITFIEGLYAGLPVVSTRLGGAAEILTDECGLLTPPGDAQALAAALASLIAEPDRRRALGDRGPARASALCDPPTVLARLAGLLGQVAAHGAGVTR